MQIVDQGEEVCSVCGDPIFSWYTFVGLDGELDGEQTDYCRNKDGMCIDCYERVNSEEEKEEEE